MTTVSTVILRIQTFIDGKISLERFDDWVEDHCEWRIDPSPSLQAAQELLDSVDAVLCEYFFDGLTQEELKEQLGKLISSINQEHPVADCQEKA